MKYFTIRWWHGDCDVDTASENFVKHYDSIKSQLPVKLIELYEKVSLHDAHLEKAEFENGNLNISLLLTDGSRIQLMYLGVTRYAIIEDRKNAFGGTGFDDLGYYEFDICGDYTQMNILYSTAIEMEIVFKSFDYYKLA